MSVQVKLIGFGDYLPARFNGKNRLRLDIETPASVRAILKSAGIDEAPDLIAMDAETVIPPPQWDEPRFGEDATLTVLSAIEGG